MKKTREVKAEWYIKNKPEIVAEVKANLNAAHKGAKSYIAEYLKTHPDEESNPKPKGKPKKDAQEA